MSIELKPTYLEMIPDVFRFVQSYVIPIVSSSASHAKIEFELAPDPEFNAGVRWLDSEHSVIFLNEGLVTRLFDFCSEHAGILEGATIDNQPDAAEEVTFTGLTYAASLVFLLLHEYSHLAAGHLSYIKECFPDTLESGLGYSEVYKAPVSEAYLRFRQMSELEADGVAFALTLEFADDICESIGLPKTNEEMHDSVQKSILIGCFVSVCLLDGLFQADERAEGEYPFSASRLLNLCSSYLRSVSPDIVKWNKGNHRFVGTSDDEIHAIAKIYQKTVVPALLILHQTLVSMGVDSELFGENFEKNPKVSTNFMQDIMMVLSGSTPLHSQYGRALVELSQHRVEFMKAMANYRKLDLWPIGD